MSSLLTALSVLAAAYLALLLYVYFSQAGMLYLPDLPTRALTASPQSLGLEYEELSIRTEDGVRLHGWYIPAAPARATVLFFHGNAGNISHRLDSIRIFHDLGLSVLIFDYRGYGRSEGAPSEAGLQRDALAAWRYLVEERRTAPARIVLFGRSLGASLAAWLAARQSPGAVIVESAFTSVPDMAAEHYGWLPVRQLTRFRHATLDDITKVMSPVLVVHSPDDEIIPFRHGEAIYAAVRGPKMFLRLRGGHNDGFMLSGADYPRGLDRFLDRHLAVDRPP